MHYWIMSLQYHSDLRFGGLWSNHFHLQVIFNHIKNSLDIPTKSKSSTVFINEPSELIGPGNGRFHGSLHLLQFKLGPFIVIIRKAMPDVRYLSGKGTDTVMP